MKLGYLCQYSEAEVARASLLGFDSLEIHADSIAPLTSIPKARAAAREASKVFDGYGVDVTAVSHYGGNALGGRQAEEVKKYRCAFAIAKELGTKVVATLTGGAVTESADENLKRFGKVFTVVAKAARDAGMKVAFENWPGCGVAMPLVSRNLARSPMLWAKMFDAVPSKALGLEFDPSHLVRIGCDHMAMLREFADRVYHVHAKDTEMLYDQIAWTGYYDGKTFRYRIPGYGEINWAEFIAGLVEIGYDGGVAIEHEDPVFSGKRFEEGLVRGIDVLSPLIHPGVV